VGDPVSGDGVVLQFSVDTLRFDTVFTQLGSATRSLKVFNTSRVPVEIDRIRLQSGSESRFRYNVDGLPGEEFSRVRIEAEDSIYVFVEVTVNPDLPVSISPFVIEERLIFETGTVSRSVLLEAWGQNANYVPSRFNQGGLALLSCNLGEVTWDDPKPYVIYGFLLIDSCTLNLPAGTRIHVHGGVARTQNADDETIVYNDGLIYTFPRGRIRAMGTVSEPVIIQGDRLEPAFAELPGQWVGMRLSGKGNELNHLIIKNSLIGIIVDSSAELTIRSSQIYNTEGAGLIGIHSKITALNCLFYNNGNRCVQLGYGGEYQFSYCTLASYGVDAPALSLSNGICRDPLCQDFDVNRLQASFRNSIIYGSRRDEIALSDFTLGNNPNLFQISMQHCIVKVDELLDPNKGGYPEFLQSTCNPCLNPAFGTPLFVDPNAERDYRPDSLSVARGYAQPIPGIPNDLAGNMRNPVNPDAGCYEWVEE
jgi:hypothetical protein